MKKELQISVGEYSNKGRKDVNQDFHDICIPKGSQLLSKGVAIALSDGISSSDVSQIASKTSVVSFLSDYYSTPETWSVKKSVQRVLNATNSWLNSQSNQGKYYYDRNRGYVCTFSAMIIRSSTAHIFHIGDSRIYRIRDGATELLTEDHRLWVSKEKSYLSRALGMEGELKIDYESFLVQEGDIYLFMTDGIYEYVQPSFMMDTIERYGDDLDTSAKVITNTAYENGSVDNLTIEIIRVDSLPSKDSSEIQAQFCQKPFPPILEAGKSFDGYEIVRELSSSHRSHVYLAIDKETDTKVVIKIPSIDMRDDKAYIERFMMEEWIANRINNTHVLKSYESSREKNYIYTLTEFVEGQTLSQWMIDNPRPSIEKVREIVEQIAKAIQAFHRLEMIHQDIRPHNIIIDKNSTIKLIDFGSTRIEGIADVDAFIEQEHILGTALYSAPEYFLGENGSQSSDIFSLGVIVYQMLSSDLPYGVNVARANSVSAQKKLKYKELHFKDQSIPVWIEEAIKKALSVNPYKRYNELSEFIYDLRHPNEDFLRKSRAPLYEREPVVFWKITSLFLSIVIALFISGILPTPS